MLDSPLENTTIHVQEHPTHVFWGEEDQLGYGCHALCLNFREVLVASRHDAVHVGYGSPYRQADTLGAVGTSSLLFLPKKADVVSQETREVRKGKDNIVIGFAGFPIARASLWSLCPGDTNNYTYYQSHLGNLAGGDSRTLVPVPPRSLDRSIRGGRSSGCKEIGELQPSCFHFLLNLFTEQRWIFSLSQKDRGRESNRAYGREQWHCLDTLLKEQPNWVIESFRRTPSVLK